MRSIGAQRYHDRRNEGIPHTGVALPLSPQLNDEVAALAEQYFGDLYGLPIDTGRVPDNGDFKVGGYVLDIKWTPRSSGCIVTFVNCRIKADIYVLILGMPGSFRIAGWTWGKLHRRRFGDLGHGIRNLTKPGELRHDVDFMMSKIIAPDGAKQ
jgi:hypothetical protein